MAVLSAFALHTEFILFIEAESQGQWAHDHLELLVLCLQTNSRIIGSTQISGLHDAGDKLQPLGCYSTSLPSDPQVHFDA